MFVVQLFQYFNDHEFLCHPRFFQAGAFEATNLSQGTYGVVGIGGGSVQMTFQPTDTETLKETSLSKQLRTVKLYQQSIQLYTHR